MKTIALPLIGLLVLAGLCTCNLEKIEDMDGVLCPTPPVAAFSATPDDCAAACEVVLVNNSTHATSFSWSFGDGATSTLTTPPAKTYATPGNYTITLIAIGEGGCRDTAQQQISVRQANQVVASFTFSDHGCSAPCTVQFTNNSQNAVNYTWDFGDMGVSSESSPNHTYLTRGNYTVRLIATGPSGSDTAVATVPILKLPTADFTISNNNCTAPCTVTFLQNSQDATAYTWNFGDGSPASNSSSPTHLFQDPGVYDVRLIALNVDGADTIVKNVTIKSPYFSTVLNVNGADLTPLYGVQRNDGNYHILFNQSGYKSVLISESQQVGTIATYSIPELEELHGIVPAGDGGFGLVGIDFTASGQAAIAKIALNQVLAFKKSFHFKNGSQLSYGQGIGLNSSNQFIVTGSYIPTGGGDMYPGFALVSQTGTISTNTNVNTPVASIGATFGVGITQLSNGEHMIIAPQWSFFGGGDNYVIRTSSLGSYTQSTNLGTDLSLKQIVSIGTTSFVIRSVSGFSISRHNSFGAVIGTTTLTGLSDPFMAVTTDGNLALCATGSGAVVLRKYNTSMSLIWEKTYPVTGGTAVTKSVAQTGDGGYLITAAFTASDGKKQLLLIRTDENGNAN